MAFLGIRFCNAHFKAPTASCYAVIDSSVQRDRELRLSVTVALNLGNHFVFLKALGGVIDLSNTQTVAQRTSFQVTGGQIALGSGTAEFTGTSIITISSGTLTAGTLRVATGADLTATGIITGNVENRGLLRPGNTLGTLCIDGNFTQLSTGTLFAQSAIRSRLRTGRVDSPMTVDPANGDKVKIDKKDADLVDALPV